MNKYEVAILTAIPPLLIAATAWLRAEVAHKRIAAIENRLRPKTRAGNLRGDGDVPLS